MKRLIATVLLFISVLVVFFAKNALSQIQPYFRYESASAETIDNTGILSGGLNYYLKGHNAKASFDYTVFNHPEADAQSIVTVQLAVGI